MRHVSVDGLRELLAEDMTSVWVFGVEFGPNTTEPNAYSHSYFVANGEDITFEGNTYRALPLEVTLASDAEDMVPQAKLRIDNVSRELTGVVRATKLSPTVWIRVFRIDSSKAVHLELGPSRFTLLNVTVNSATVEGVLGYEGDFLNEPAVFQRFTPTLAPGLF